MSNIPIYVQKTVFDYSSLLIKKKKSLFTHQKIILINSTEVQLSRNSLQIIVNHRAIIYLNSSEYHYKWYITFHDKKGSSYRTSQLYIFYLELSKYIYENKNVLVLAGDYLLNFTLP